MPDITTGGPASGPHTTQDERRANAAYAREPRALVGHPWDAYGEPQPLDDPEVAWYAWECPAKFGHEPRHRDPAECIADLEEEAIEHREQADRYRESSYEEDDQAAECDRLAEELRPRAPRPRLSPGQEPLPN